MKDANLKLQFGITTRLESSVQKKTFVGYIELSKVHFESNLWVKYYVVCNREWKLHCFALTQSLQPSWTFSTVSISVENVTIHSL